MSYNQFWKKVINQPGHVLDPVSRLSEVVFGLIMVLTFTGSVSAATAQREEVKVVLWAALGCNAAWGIVDAFMYLMSIMLERGAGLKALQKIRKISTSEEAAEIIREYLPPVLAEVVQAEQLQDLHRRLGSLPEPPEKAMLTWRDVKGAIGIFLLVFFSTFPATIPFLFIENIATAMRASNGVALLLLFLTGFYLGKQSGYNAWLVGVLVCAIGVVLVLITIALGG